MISSDCRDSPFDPQAICATMRHMNLVPDGAPCVCEPLSGGVSSDIWKVGIGGERYCLKRALPRLRVPQLWEAPVARNAFEWEWLKLAGTICPEAVPELVTHDPQAGLFVMTYLDPEQYPSWKNQLRDGIIQESVAQAVAERLVRIHAATADQRDIARRFATDASFYAIRLEPYLVATGKMHRDLQERLDTLVRTTASIRRSASITFCSSACGGRSTRRPCSPASIASPRPISQASPGSRMRASRRASPVSCRRSCWRASTASRRSNMSPRSATRTACVRSRGR